MLGRKNTELETGNKHWAEVEPNIDCTARGGCRARAMPSDGQWAQEQDGWVGYAYLMIWEDNKSMETSLG